ncbi:MAG TPA: cell division protein FtsH, partial [Chthoniobacterales bacterium]
LARDMSRGRDYSEATAQQIDAEVKRLIDEAYQHATEILEKNRDKVEVIAKALLEYETLDASHVKEIIEFGSIQNPPLKEVQPPPLPPPPMSDAPPAPEKPERNFPAGGLPAPSPA